MWHKRKVEIIFFSLCLLFASWLMLSSLSYSNGGITMADKIWSDFMSHIPLTRSFSMGQNFPPEAPLFAGERIKYHFLFFMFAGFLEKIGVRIDWAINIPSIAGFVALMFSIYYLGYKIGKRKVAGIFANLLFLFNPSFSWLYYFTDNKLNLHTVSDFIHNSSFAAFGPYDDKLVSAFWTWNVYINQRHLAFSFAAMFLCVWLIVYSRGKRFKIAGIILIALMPLLNKAMLLILFILLGLHILGRPKQRVMLIVCTLIAGLLAIPGLAYLSDAATSIGDKGFRYYPGFLYNATTWKDVNLKDPSLKWILYWILNLGFLPVAAVIGMLQVERFVHLPDKATLIKRLNLFLADIFGSTKVWFFSALVVFVIANTWVFATDIATNHKLINYVIIIFDVYAGIFLANLFKNRRFIFAVIVIFVLTFGGILDAFPVINSNKLTWLDVQSDVTSNWIAQNTKPSDNFLNLTYEVGQVVITGRKVYFGWDYLNWSVGYDTEGRRAPMQKLATGKLSKQEVCDFLYKNNLPYILVNESALDFAEIKVDKDYFRNNFKQPAGIPKNGDTIIYGRDLSCAD